MVDFTVTLYHSGVFIQNPLKYVHGQKTIISDINFEEMRYNDVVEVVSRLVNSIPRKLYFSKPGTTLSRGITEMKSDADVDECMSVGYKNGFKVDLYSEHHGYDVLEMVRDDHAPRPDTHLVGDDVSSDEECEVVPEFVDAQNEGEDNVVIKRLSTNDHFLNKLVGNGNFIGITDYPIPTLEGSYLEEIDPEEDFVENKYKVKSGITYPAFNPSTQWNEQKPVLGIRYESPYS